MIDAPIVDDELALLWMVNMACIDMNTWYSRVDKPDRPDWVLFDLDPSPDVGFAEVVEVALLVRQVLDASSSRAVPKTSGADGMHVLVPIARRSTYGAVREFAEIVARTLATTHRGLVTTEWSKRKRRGVLIDANQNGEGKTIASAYSVRPAPGACVDAAALGRGEGGARPAGLHDGRCARPRRAPRRPVRPRARGAAVLRRRSRRSASRRPDPVARSLSAGGRALAELGGRAAEEERHGPVGPRASELAGETSGSWRRWYERVTRHQAGKPRRRVADDIGDPLVAPERRHLAEHAGSDPARAIHRQIAVASRRAWRSACWEVGGVGLRPASPRSARGRSPSAPTS